MKLIANRRDTITELQVTNPMYGVEVDARREGQRLIIHHDPFVAGKIFDEWLDSYPRGTLVINVKEGWLIVLAGLKGIEDFFFLDQSFLFLVKWFRAGERRCAVRVSEFESVETALTLVGKVDWVWVDCFPRFPLTHCDTSRLQSSGFKLCLVSPELHGRIPEVEMPVFTSILKNWGISVDAVCINRPDLWDSLL